MSKPKEKKPGRRPDSARPGKTPDRSKYQVGRSRRPETALVPRRDSPEVTDYEKYGARQYENAQGSVSHATLMHTKYCKLCVLDEESPGILEQVKALYFRFMSAVDIEELLGYTNVEEIDGNTGEVSIKTEPLVPERTIRRHAMFFGWQSERAQNTNGILDIVVNIGFEQVLRKGEVSEQMMMSAMDMRNKLEGKYFKAMKNPREIKVQMMATVMSILQAHHAKGMLDVTKRDIIESLSTRPGFNFIKIILREELEQ